ncbi:IMPACT family protein [Saccharicrinis fermentans]|uniref:IMPACT family member YigZ n=1 Tax=Saccharicrinis fermentans DSM 9555 = JCM 21142 TaxID=869213 RepID=W7Y7V2_9BACT|nr:YigZ family protein [Saccharicrinis fermentans]GAF04312.1 IMPACT family member YigZ [Saccharicrinis fermentans DSM 9555 = JCM 21142]
MGEIKDKYKTIAAPSEGIYKEKGSKFISYAYPVYSEDEIKEHVRKLKDEFYDARHHCFAWQLGTDGLRYRANDDGEPSGTAGKPIYGQLRSMELTNILVVVVRYFGGTKLGVPGLIRAYKEATIDAIANADIIEKTVDDLYSVKFDYLVMNDIMKIVKDENLIIANQKFDLSCELEFSIRQSEVQKVLHRFEKVDSVKCEYLRTQ